MTLSDLSIKRPVFAWMLMFGLIVFGWISMGRLGVSQMPDYDFPVVTVNVQWPGTAPELMETEIVDRLEQSLISVSKVRDIISNIRQGNANITLEFDIDRNVDAALQEVQSNISRVRLPNDVDPPVITKTNPDDQPIMYIGISSTRTLRELIVYADLYLRDQFQIIPGVGEIILSGFAERNLRIWIDNNKLKQYELTVLDIKKSIETDHYETAAGVIENNRQEMNVRAMGEGLTPEAVGDILITQRGGKPIYNPTLRIKDIAKVEDGLNDIRRITRISGTPGLGLGIKKQRGENAVEVSKLVRKKMAEIKKTLPKDIEMDVNFDSTIFIDESIGETKFTLVLSAIVTGLVCWMFLGSWNATFNVLLSIPTSVIGSFMILYFMGFTLNMFTLLGLALAVGIVVDDAIMVLENIVRHLQMGKDRVKASRDGAREITFAAVAASVAVIAIFLPVAFMKGIIGKFFFQFGVTISGAVALSLLEAITLTPMRCSQMLTSADRFERTDTHSHRIFTALANFYKSTLHVALSMRWTVVIISLLLFAASIYSIRFIRKELMPAQDQSVFLVRYQTPTGSSLNHTSEKVKVLEEYLKEKSDVIRRFMVAIGGFGGGEVNTGIMFVSMKPMNQRSISQDEFMNQFRADMKSRTDMKIVTQDLSLRGFTAQRGFPVEFNIRGPNWETLQKSADEMVKRMEATGLVVDVDTDFRVGQPEVQVIPSRENAAASGVTMQTISDTVEAAIGGVRQGRFTQDGRRYDVRLRLTPEERLKPEDIANLQVRTLYGELIPISDVTSIKEVKTLQTITRRNRERSISIFANVAPERSQAEALDAAQKIGQEILPEGTRLYLSGGAQTFKESFESLQFALWIGVLVAYMILAAQFNSFLHPVTVLLALPFSLSGAFLALLATNQSLNLYSFIGIVLLMGIVKKNSILLVEFTNQKREEGLSLREALMMACPVRLRPILMTSVATLAAAIPPALALGPGAESRIPMSITIIGGVLVSTVFTLYVVPCAYSLMAPLERKKTQVSLD